MLLRLWPLLPPRTLGGWLNSVLRSGEGLPLASHVENMGRNKILHFMDWTFYVFYGFCRSLCSSKSLVFQKWKLLEREGDKSRYKQPTFFQRCLAWFLHQSALKKTSVCVCVCVCVCVIWRVLCESVWMRCVCFCLQVCVHSHSSTCESALHSLHSSAYYISVPGKHTWDWSLW